ncbi:hypothetical protein [Escherichia coli]|uniref:hypothetical protein n=1 Tax=Escherichia coli TaxID=562 RepID=UPI002074B744|nr:hypothetical protein [Escherichia coli]
MADNFQLKPSSPPLTGYPARLKVCSVSLRDFRKKSPALLWALPGGYCNNGALVSL